MSLEEEANRLQHFSLGAVVDTVAPRNRRSHSNSSERTRTSGSASGSTSGSPTSDDLFKTELCRSYESTGACKYGAKCRFAHGQAELRPVARHPKYKTQQCKTFREQGHCPYGARCKFIHSDQDELPVSAPGQLEHMAVLELARQDNHRDRRSASVDGPMALALKQPPLSRSSSEFASPRSPLGQMSPFQDLSPRSPEVHRRGSPRGETQPRTSPRAPEQPRTSPRVRGHATMVVIEDDARFAFVQQKKDRLPIFKDIVGGGSGATADGSADAGIGEAGGDPAVLRDF